MGILFLWWRKEIRKSRLTAVLRECVSGYDDE